MNALFVRRASYGKKKLTARRKELITTFLRCNIDGINLDALVEFLVQNGEKGVDKNDVTLWLSANVKQFGFVQQQQQQQTEQQHNNYTAKAMPPQQPPMNMEQEEPAAGCHQQLLATAAQPFFAQALTHILLTPTLKHMEYDVNTQKIWFVFGDAAVDQNVGNLVYDAQVYQDEKAGGGMGNGEEPWKIQVIDISDDED